MAKPAAELCLAQHVPGLGPEQARLQTAPTPVTLVSLLPWGMRAQGECKPPRQLLTAPGGWLDAANAPAIAGLPPAVDYLGFPKMTYD